MVYDSYTHVFLINQNIVIIYGIHLHHTTNPIDVVSFYESFFIHIIDGIMWLISYGIL